MSKNNQTKKQINPFIKSLKVFVLIIAVAAVAVVGGALGYTAVTGDRLTTVALAEMVGLEINEETGAIILPDWIPAASQLPERLNVLILGIDEETGDIGRADLVMIVSMDTSTGYMDLISIPRDTFVTIPPERMQIMRDAGLNTAPASGNMRINEIAVHAGRRYGANFSRLQVEELLDIDIHYYIRVDLDAFEFIIDEIGGVEFNVPRRMFYTDPAQNLVIDLHPGLQTLNGADAAGLVRYRQPDLHNPISRGHPDGDFGRMRMQQDFMVVALGQMLDRGNIVSNATTYIRAFFSYVDTDFSLMSMPRYINLVTLIDTSNIQAHTLPGRGTMISGRYFFILNEEDTAEIIAEIFDGADDE